MTYANKELSERLEKLGCKSESAAWCRVEATDEWELRPFKTVFGAELDLGHDYSEEVDAFSLEDCLRPENAKLIFGKEWGHGEGNRLCEVVSDTVWVSPWRKFSYGLLVAFQSNPDKWPEYLESTLK